jgi:4-amino-4-deoxy-L-arabinose transferase-like glycosyltransferase
MSVQLPALVLGLALGLASIVVYAIWGYDWKMLLLWLVGLIALGASFFSRSPRLPRFERLDLLAPVGLALLFAPLYLARLYDWPVQVTTDEPTIMDVSDEYASKSGVDPFGFSTYQNRPALLFIVWGKLGLLIGGIDLFHMRLLHALVGLIAIGASYALFKQLLPRSWALFAASLFGLSHSFLIISRLAMRENTAVLMEIVALALLLWGLRHQHVFVTFCGGVAAGLGFYVYHPGRAAFPLWVVFLLGLALLYRHRFGLRKLALHGSVAFVGFVLLAAPLLISESKAPEIGREVDPMVQLLITAEGREFQKDWIHADTVWEGYRQNVSLALTAFNSDAIDRGFIYVNEGHGFVDPVTGIALWVGVAVVGLALIRRRREVEPWPLLMVGSFLVLWLAFAFLINQAPKYPRLLITLPFVAYLVTEAVRVGARWLERVVARWDPVRARRSSFALAAGTLVAVAAGNLAIAWDYVDKGRDDGEPVGSTGRYIAAHPERSFYLVADEEGTYKYFDRGHPDWWLGWMGRFEEGVGARDVVRTDEVQTFTPQRPFGLLMSVELWNAVGAELGRKYEQERVRIRSVTPDGRLVVFEVPARI